MSTKKKVYAVNLEWEVVGGKKNLNGILTPEQTRFIGTEAECNDFVKEKKPAPAPTPAVEETSTSPKEESMEEIFSNTNPALKVEQNAAKAWGQTNRRNK